jgi:hypothetical protein
LAWKPVYLFNSLEQKVLTSFPLKLEWNYTLRQDTTFVTKGRPDQYELLLPIAMNCQMCRILGAEVLKDVSELALS